MVSIISVRLDFRIHSRLYQYLSYIQELASADEHCVVKEIHEFFGDYIPIDTDHYTLNLTDGLQLCRQPNQWKVTENNIFHRATDVEL